MKVACHLAYLFLKDLDMLLKSVSITIFLPKSKIYAASGSFFPEYVLRLTFYIWASGNGLDIDLC